MEKTTSTELEKEIKSLEKEIMEKKVQLAVLRKKLPFTETENATFKDVSGKPVTLSELFGEKDELLLVHNMGKSCVYCTLWADEYNGMFHHLSNRAAFAVVSPDDHKVMKEFAGSRNWKFSIYSSAENDFKRSSGFGTNEKPQPGVSVFLKRDGKIFHSAHTGFGPGDNYCSFWDYIQLLPDGWADWSPKYKY